MTSRRAARKYRIGSEYLSSVAIQLSIMLTTGLVSESVKLCITRINDYVTYEYREFDPLLIQTLVFPILSSLILVLQQTTSG